jgi:glycosyltransferase involved in cell wall biosynthesis
MKILFLNSSYPGMKCGVGAFTAQLAENISRYSSHRVTVVTSNLPEIERSRQVKVIPKFADWSWRDFFRHYPTLLKEWPRVVIVQYPTVMPGPHSDLTFWAPLLLKVFLPFAKIIYVVHEFADTIPASRRKLKRAFRFSYRVLYGSRADRSPMERENLSLADKFQFIPTASSIPRATASKTEVASLRQAVGKPSGKILYFFGFIDPTKGFDTLLEAMAGLPKNVTLVVSGGPRPGNRYHQKIKRLITRRGLSSRVRWLGFLAEAEAAKWFQASDLAVLPFSEGFASNRTSALAAFVNGAAVITTTGPGLPSYLKDRQNAMVVAPGNPAELAAAIKAALASAPLRARLRKGSRALAPRFSGRRVARETLRAF